MLNLPVEYRADFLCAGGSNGSRQAPNTFDTMLKRILPITIVLFLPISLWGQQAGKAKQSRQYYNTLLRSNPVLQTVLIDSLNSRVQPVLPNGKVLHSPYLKDTVQQLFYQHVAELYGSKHLQEINKGLRLLKDTSRISSYMAEKLRGFYALRNETAALSFMKKDAYSNRVKVLSGSAFYDNTPGAVLQSGFGAQIEDNLVIGNIPVNIVYNNMAATSPIDRSLIDQHLKKFSFDKDAYMQRMNGYLNKAYDLKKYFLGDIDVSAAVKSFAAQQIDELKEQMNAMVDPGQAGIFNGLVSPEQLIYLDSSQLKRLMLDDKRLQLTEEDLNGKWADSSLYSSPHGKTIMAARQYLNKVSSLKQSVNQGLQTRELMTAQRATGQHVQTLLDDRESSKRNIRELLPLNFLQRLLLQTKSLNIGNIAASGSKGGVQDLFMSGFQGAFLNNNKFLQLGIGGTRQGGDIKDLNFASSLDPGAYAIQFLQMGKGDVDGAHSHISMVNANTRNKQFGPFSANSLKRNIFVGAFSEQISLGEYGTITADISKSNNEFNNAAVGNSYALTSKTAAFTLLNDFWQTFSAGMDYNGEWKAANMSQRVYFNYSGLAYTNPASPGGSRGTIRYGLNVRRHWNKRRLTLGFRTDMMDMKTAAISAGGWRNRQYAIDARIRVKKNFSLTTRMSQSVMKHTGDGLAQPGYLNRQINVSSQLSGKLFSLLQTNNSTFGLQQMNILPLKSLLLNLNVNHSIVINTHVLTVGLFYNKDIKDNALYGNLFTAETGWSYQLGKILNCTSGINYLDNKDVVRQVGLRQTINTSLAGRLNVSLFADCRKNLMNTAQNYLFGNFSTQLALNYQLNR